VNATPAPHRTAPQPDAEQQLQNPSARPPPPADTNQYLLQCILQPLPEPGDSLALCLQCDRVLLVSRPCGVIMGLPHASALRQHGGSVVGL
jgi:hypothetical protein